MVMMETGLAELLVAIIFLFFCFVPIAARILFGVAAYNDARSKLNQNALMWGLLIGFLGLIPGIIYLCVRNNPTNEFVHCMRCGAGYHVAYTNCPRCGEPNSFHIQYLNPFAEQQRHRAKVLCIVAAVLAGLSVLGGIVTVVLFVGLLA
jgi:ribosomal protein L37E